MIAFLRAVNVGGPSPRTADLTSLIHDPGYREVRTLLRTGNVVLRGRSRLSARKLAALVTGRD